MIISYFTSDGRTHSLRPDIQEFIYLFWWPKTPTPAKSMILNCYPVERSHAPAFILVSQVENHNLLFSFWCPGAPILTPIPEILTLIRSLTYHPKFHKFPRTTTSYIHPKAHKLFLKDQKFQLMRLYKHSVNQYNLDPLPVSGG